MPANNTAGTSPNVKGFDMRAQSRTRGNSMEWSESAGRKIWKLSGAILSGSGAILSGVSAAVLGKEEGVNSGLVPPPPPAPDSTTSRVGVEDDINKPVVQRERGNSEGSDCFEGASGKARRRIMVAAGANHSIVFVQDIV